ncbi:hypothetical protein [Massilia suwonensis]|uniref:Uncharacterized protein n=1 Tax=Massilia suwonensis TaxID=648895 RepID=A0ABW0MQZ6_9BURK
MHTLLAAKAFFKTQVLHRVGIFNVFPVLLIALLLQGCGIPVSDKEFDETAEAKYLQTMFDSLVRQNYPGIEAAFDQRLTQADARQALQQMHALVPKEAPVKKLPVLWNFQSKVSFSGQGTSERTANVAFEYEYPSSRWLLVSAALSGEPGNFRIVGFHVDSLAASLAKTNAFTLQGKTFVHYVFLLMTLVSAALAVYALVICLRTKGLKRKWLWALCTLVTLSAFNLNWTTGEWAFQVFRLNLLGWGVMRSGWVGPWTMSFPIPAGALLFLWRHYSRTSLEAPAETVAPSRP